MTGEEWTEKYRPQHLNEIIGHKKIIEELRKWAASWEKGTSKDRAVILYGKAGVGKTTAAHAIAREFGWDTIELNASDSRTADVIQRVAGSAAQMGTFEGTRGRRLIILDEADNIHGNADRGGANAVIKVISETNQPIILIANEYYDMSKTLRDSCKSIRFKAIRTTTITTLLKKIAASEDLRIEHGAAETIAIHSNGDVRSAINDLQAISEGRNEVTTENITVSLRDSKETVFQVISKIFKGSNLGEAHGLTFQLNETPEDLIQWIDENLPLVYRDPSDLTDSFDALSHADVFLGRVRRRENYRMWKHASLLMSGGVAVSKTHHYKGARLKPPSTWQRLARTRSIRRTQDSIALKIGKHCHTSKSFAKKELINFIERLMQDENKATLLSAELDFTEEEIAHLLQTKTTNKKVKKIYKTAKTTIKQEKEYEIESYAGITHQTPRTETPKIKEEKTTGKKEKEEAKKTKKPQITLFDF
ncbi:replication factor C large subunit [Methanosarcinales archaeon]|nr:MAG: replication factor C large subunit [Methanosarcinales archaeon]